MRKCETCKIDKNEDQFCKEKRRKDGLCKQCKHCLANRKAKFRTENLQHVKEIANKSRTKNRDKIIAKWHEKYPSIKEKYCAKRRDEYWENRERIRGRQNHLHKLPAYREKSRVRQSKWRQANEEKIYKIAKKWIQNNRHKKRCHYAISDAIRRGDIMRPDNCQECGISCKPDAHHPDYTKPLDVQWLCRICHAKETFK